MKINKIIIAVIAAVVIPIIVFSLFGIEITPLLMLFLYYGIPVAMAAYLLILVKRYVAAKASEPKISTDLHAKIVLLNESMQRIEKKVEKIEKILEKVSD